MEMRRRLLALVALVSACGTPTIDEYILEHAGRIDGTIFYPSGSARGKVVLLLFDSQHLPPPDGTSMSVTNLIVVPEETLFRGVSKNVVQDFAAPFIMPVVPPGTYQIRAFLDADGNFNPVVADALLAEPTAGDVAGGYIDRDTRKFLPIEVKADEITAQITVTLGLTIPVERPAFAITSTPTYTTPYATPQRLTLSAHPLSRSLVKMDPQKTAFLIQYVDDDRDGKPDDKNGDHLPDVFPQVLLRRIDPAPDASGAIVIPGIVDPYPFLDQLAARGSAITAKLDVLLPPVSVLHGATDTIMPDVPPGTYEVNVIESTGQTWTVPNHVDDIDPGPAPDPTQSQPVIMAEGPPLPRGAIGGKIRAADDKKGDAYVFAFDERNPPPPLAGGRPVAVATIPAASFAPVGGGQLEAPFVVPGLPDGRYILEALVDPTASFSLLDDLVAQPQRGDVVGPAMTVVVPIMNQGTVQGVELDLTIPILFDRPAFEIGDVQIPRTSFPAAIELKSHPIAVLKMTDETVKVPIVLAPGDEDGDNLRDLYPRVVFTKIVDSGDDPRIQPDDPSGIFIPGIVDPIPFLVPLATGAPALPASSYRVILPPAAVKLLPNGMRQIFSPPPAGRYRTNVLSATGQTWSVPSDLDLILRRQGTPLEDSTQARVVRVVDSPVPMGAITGMIQLLAPPPSGPFEVVVLAFAKTAPPPPLGAGRPVSALIVPKSEFNGGSMAAYVLGGLATGTYQIRAFLDANHDFVPWFDTMNQPDAGDVGGGALDLGTNPPALKDIPVDALGMPAMADVEIVQPLMFRIDRPVFGITGAGPIWDGGQPVGLDLNAAAIDNDLIHQHGVFPIQWIDLDQNGMADDYNGDLMPDVFPLVVAELLDPADDTNLTVSSMHVRVVGSVNPAQFPTFPSMDPTQVLTVVPAGALHVVFPPVAIDAMFHPIPVPAGKYRITLIDGSSQTWTVPNELQRAAGTMLPTTQAGVLTVRR
jgi:hypothetical protein